MPFPHYTTQPVDAKAIAEWSHRLGSTDDSKIRIATRRILSCLTTRSDPVDGFIDAVIAWENLFAQANSELGFRISTAMAVLLEETPADRLACQKQINASYGLRSKVVHGCEDPQSFGGS